MRYHEKISRILSSGKRSELRHNIDRIECIDYMLVLRSHKRVILIKLHGIGSEALKPLNKVFPHLCSFLRMGNRVMLLGHDLDILYYTGCRKALMIGWFCTWTSPHTIREQGCKNDCERENNWS